MEKTNILLPENLEKKYRHLQDVLCEMGRVLVAFSGGVDSTFLLKVAHEVLGENVLAVTATSDIHLDWEIEEAVNFARLLKIRHLLVQGTEMRMPDFVKNPPDRCYLCKKEVFSHLKTIAEKEDIPHVADGANMDDDSDYRPGSRATRELDIRSPLREAGMYKAEIRILSKSLALPTWNKPPLACLASRIPYGTEITPENLKQIARSEDYLRSLGFSQVRVRHHGPVARIEIVHEEFDRICDPEFRNRISEELKKAGYSYVAVDLKGYRTGSLNEPLKIDLSE